MTIEMIKNKVASGELVRCHTTTRRGYESRKTGGHVEEYEGKFGKGFVHVEPRWDTTQYVYVTYYLER